MLSRPSRQRHLEGTAQDPLIGICHAQVALRGLVWELLGLAKSLAGFAVAGLQEALDGGGAAIALRWAQATRALARGVRAMGPQARGLQATRAPAPESPSHPGSWAILSQHNLKQSWGH